MMIDVLRVRKEITWKVLGIWDCICSFFSNIMHNVLFLLVLIQSDTAKITWITKEKAMWIQSFKIIANTDVLGLPVICLANLICIWCLFWVCFGKGGENFLCRKLKWLAMCNLVMYHYWACIQGDFWISAGKSPH